MTQDKKTFGATILRVLMAPLAALPLKFNLRCAKFYAWVFRDLLHYRRDVVMINLSRSFPEKKYGELKKIADRFYQHLGDLIAEAIWFGGCRGEKGRKRLHESMLVDVVNPEYLNSMFETCNNSMFLTSHQGNWEILGGWYSYNHSSTPFLSDYSNIGVVYKELRSKAWDRFLGDNRCAPALDTDFDGYLESKQVFRFAITHRKQKFIYIFPTDQYPYASAGRHDIGEFLHQQTWAMTGGSSLACKFGMSVSYLRWKCIERGKYTIEMVPICEDASKETPEGIMRKYYDLLEKDIQAQPWLYLWTHRRWK